MKLGILTVVDMHSRLCPAADPRFFHRREDVVQTLERVCGRIGSTRTIRVELPMSWAIDPSNHN